MDIKNPFNFYFSFLTAWRDRSYRSPNPNCSLLIRYWLWWRYSTDVVGLIPDRPVQRDLFLLKIPWLFRSRETRWRCQCSQRAQDSEYIGWMAILPLVTRMIVLMHTLPKGASKRMGPTWQLISIDQRPLRSWVIVLRPRHQRRGFWVRNRSTTRCNLPEGREG